MTQVTELGAPTQKAGFALGLNETGIAYVALAVLLVGATLWSGLGPQVEHTDFSMTYIGASMVHLGHGARLYDFQEQIALRQSTFKQPSPLLFEHPPFEALIFSPLAALPYRDAYLVWALLNTIIWLSLPLLLRPYAPAPHENLGYLALWLLFAPLGVALFQGQSSLALLLLYTLCFVHLKRGRGLAAGLCLGLGLFKFQFVLPFALIFLLRRKWRFLTGFALSAAFLGVLSLVAVGWRGVLSYIRFLAIIAGDPHNASYGNAIGMATAQGFFNAILRRYVPANVISVFVAAVSLGLVGFTVWCWQRLTGSEACAGSHPEGRHEPRPESEDLMFAAAVAVSLAAGFHMFTHDFSPLVLSLFLVAAHLPGRNRRALRYALGAVLFLFWSPPFFFVLLARHSGYALFPLLLVFALGTLRLAATPPLSPEDNQASSPTLFRGVQELKRITS